MVTKNWPLNFKNSKVTTNRSYSNDSNIYGCADWKECACTLCRNLPEQMNGDLRFIQVQKFIIDSENKN